MMVTVEYFGQLRDLCGKDREQMTVECDTAIALRDALHQRNNWPGKAEQIRVAVNNILANDATPLQEQDTVALLPPVSGG